MEKQGKAVVHDLIIPDCFYDEVHEVYNKKPTEWTADDFGTIDRILFSILYSSEKKEIPYQYEV